MRPSEFHPKNTLAGAVIGLGSKGDGYVQTPEGQGFHVPFVAVGEEISFVPTSFGHGQLAKIITPVPERIDPICPHFTHCGGCGLQHVAADSLLEWKMGRVVEALNKANVSVPENGPKAAIAAWGDGRRRATFHGVRKSGVFEFGFMARASRHIVQPSACPVLDIQIASKIPDLAKLGAHLLKTDGALDMVVNLADNGLDVSIETPTGSRAIGPPETASQSATLARQIEEAGIARLSFSGLSALSRDIPRLDIFGFSVELPPAAFLQASARAQSLMSETLLAWAGTITKKQKPDQLKKKRWIIDLFAGLGTFTFPLKSLAPVRAYEGDKAAMAALQQAADKKGGGHPCQSSQRDLFLVPLGPLEMDDVFLAVLDPPRAGAQAQIGQIAASTIEHVIYISCDAQSFARDAAILTENGFRLEEISAFDQFRFSHHVEIMGRFLRVDVDNNSHDEAQTEKAKKAPSLGMSGAIKPLPRIGARKGKK